MIQKLKRCIVINSPVTRAHALKSRPTVNQLIQKGILDRLYATTLAIDIFIPHNFCSVSKCQHIHQGFSGSGIFKVKSLAHIMRTLMKVVGGFKILYHPVFILL